MPLTNRQNGTGGGIVSAAWWNDYYNLLTGVMQDQEISVKNNLVLSAIGGPPTAAAVATAIAGTGMGVGVYIYTYTFTSGDGESIESPTVSVTTTSVNAQVSLSSIAVGPTGTVGRNIYRTAVGGSQRKLLHTIADNVTTTYTDAAADTTLGANAPTSPSFGGSLVIKDQNGVVKFKINNDGSFSAGGSTGFGNTSITGTLNVTGIITGQSGYVGNGKFGITTPGDVLDASGTNLYLKATSGKFVFQSPGGTSKWSRTQESWGTVSVGANATVTISHGLGTTPDIILCTPNNGTGGSQTWSVWNVGSSSFQIYNYQNSPSYYWMAFKM